MTTVRHPPGRAGRLWLRRRLATAERGTDQLTHKLQVLIRELERVQRTRDAAEQAWTAGVHEARTWQLRAGVLGGQQSYARQPAPEPVRIAITWSSVVGIGIPTGSQLPEVPGLPDLAPNAAVVAATRAFGAALRAGARLAVADEASHRIEVEIALTRRRVRALERRWLPALRAALADVEQSLELDEQEDGARLRRALRQPTTRGTPTTRAGRRDQVI
jgi:V/A-type H+-transporting ATPase subunit D